MSDTFKSLRAKIKAMCGLLKILDSRKHFVNFNQSINIWSTTPNLYFFLKKINNYRQLLYVQYIKNSVVVEQYIVWLAGREVSSLSIILVQAPVACWAGFISRRLKRFQKKKLRGGLRIFQRYCRQTNRSCVSLCFRVDVRINTLYVKASMRRKKKIKNNA